MSKTIKGGAPCSIARSVDVLRDPWSFMILREAFDGVSRFAELRDRLGIASDILTERLNVLVEAGVLTRELYREAGSRARYSYHLTEAGAELLIVLAALQQWGDAHVPWEPGPTIERVHAHTGRALHVGFIDEDGAEVPTSEVALRKTATYPDRIGR